jgi:hypothetical protein
MKIGQGIKHEFQDGKVFSCCRIEDDGGAVLKWSTCSGTAVTTTELKLSAAAIAVTAMVLQDYIEKLTAQLDTEKAQAESEDEL